MSVIVSAIHRPRELFGAVLPVALFSPPLRNLLEATMAGQMLIQMPLLALSGWWLGVAWRDAPAGGAMGRLRRCVDGCNVGGVTGLIVASFSMLLWMLPRSLDAARLDAGWDALKFATLVFPLGVVAAISWSRVPVIARALIHVEVIATLLRFGWGYVAAQERLCSAYLQGDQQRTGALLVAAGIAWGIAAAWTPLFGHSSLLSGPAARRRIDSAVR